MAMETTVKLANGQKASAAEIYVPHTLITKDNVAKFMK